MALPASVASVEDIPKGFADHYVENDDGSYRLDYEGAEDISGLKSALKRVKDERRQLKADLSTTRAEVEDLKGQIENDDDPPKGKKKDDAESARLRTEAAEATARLQQIERENKELKLRQHFQTAFAKSGGLKEDVDDVWVLTRGRYDLDDSGEVVVLDEHEEPTGQSVEKYLTDVFKKSKPKFFEGEVGSGSGAAQHKRGTGGAGDDLSSLPPAERLTRHRELQAART